jgi:hypothetical protein
MIVGLTNKKNTSRVLRFSASTDPYLNQPTTLISSTLYPYQDQVQQP